MTDKMKDLEKFKQPYCSWACYRSTSNWSHGEKHIHTDRSAFLCTGTSKQFPCDSGENQLNWEFCFNFWLWSVTFATNLQLDADDAEPHLDEKEGQDEYSQLQMPVWCAIGGSTLLIDVPDFMFLYVRFGVLVCWCVGVGYMQSSD